MIKKYTLVFIALLSTSLSAQQANLDYKVTRSSGVRQVITNLGTLLGHPLELNYPGTINSEYPVGSFEEHHGEGGIWVGSINPNGDTLVTSTISWNSPPFWETYPSAEPWDTVWSVKRNETKDIPYLGSYTAISDEDFIMRYNDYSALSLRDNRHQPLYLEFIHKVYTYSSPLSLSEVIVHEVDVIPTRNDLFRAYIALWLDPNVGSIVNGANFQDDYSIYDDDLKLAMGVDSPGGNDGDAHSPIGIMAIPPEDVNQNLLKWTFSWGSNPFAPGMIPPNDKDKYEELMSSGDIQSDQQIATGSHFVLSFGPFNTAVNDTLTFRFAQVFGDGIEGVKNNAEVLQLLIDNGFKIPAPPPIPPLKVTTDNRTVTVDWSPTAEVNPEIYTDNARADGTNIPFEGYRIYRSTQSLEGPWTLLAEYDIEDNGFGNELGIEYTYEDDFLLNNIEYYYTVTAFSKEDTVLNWPSLETSLFTNAVTAIPGTAPPVEVGGVAVVPNPYRGDVNYFSYNPPWEKPDGTRQQWLEQDRRIQFINLPARCEIKIFTVAGDLVQTLQHNDLLLGYEDWNLTSSAGQAVASDIYLFTVENLDSGKIQTGTFVIAK